ncbi:M15 family metallopeptidase [Solirubrobacter soli]|uniref:M15 family metallopeptidase n=1 Tax=Solirubrobacter soli TaxID=363832 RepID=UPI000424F6AA|nr:M15 family metallopeptidase [Solirubrobacter soli]
MTAPPTIYRTRIRRRRVAVLVGLLAAIAVGHQLPASSSETVAPVLHTERPDHEKPPRAALGVAGGAVPDGTTVFDDDVPGVANLDADLLDAVRRASTDAGLEFLVDSGWRSSAYQKHLRDQAIAKYGSVQEAARWVATPKTSAHVSGDAVDVGPATATAWLSRHGAAYGLCQIYANEPWHYELRPDAAAQGCPAMYADPTQDPRMQR